MGSRSDSSSLCAENVGVVLALAQCLSVSSRSCGGTQEHGIEISYESCQGQSEVISNCKLVIILIDNQVNFRSTHSVLVSFLMQDAMEKLLERQHKEVQETSRILEKLKKSSGKSMSEFDEEDDAFSLASSILSGVDYGFVSRSEGATTSLTGGFPLNGSELKRYVRLFLLPITFTGVPPLIKAFCPNLSSLAVHNSRSTGLPATLFRFSFSSFSGTWTQ